MVRIFSLRHLLRWLGKIHVDQPTDVIFTDPGEGRSCPLNPPNAEFGLPRKCSLVAVAANRVFQRIEILPASQAQISRGIF